MRKSKEQRLSETRAYFKKKTPKKFKDINPEIIKKIAFVFFIYIFIMYLVNSPYKLGEENRYQLSGLYHWFIFIANQTLGIVHEAGHGVCYITISNQFITAAMGTIFQIAAPYLFYHYYKKRTKVFLANIGLFFVGISMQYSAWYMSTAEETKIIPASKSFLGQEGYHDFHVIFDTIGILPLSYGLGITVMILAYIIMLKSIFNMYNVSFSKGQSQLALKSNDK